MKSYTDVRLADPFLRPYWRHERVLRMLRSVPPERCKRFDDQWIQEYKQFLFFWNKGEGHREKLLYENPGLYFAYSLYDRLAVEPELTLMIEARLLAGASIESIANDCKTIPETIQWYERLFFNVSDFLSHHDWIVKNVLLPASDRFVEQAPHDSDEASQPIIAAGLMRSQLDLPIKFFAYFGGPLVCDVMISGFRRNNHVLNTDNLAEFFNSQFTLQVQRRSAQAAGQFEVNKYNVMELLNTHVRLMELQRSDKSQEVRHNEFEKNVSAMMLEIPWSIGKNGEQLYQGTPVGKYDMGPVELNSEEAILIAAGTNLPVLEHDTGVDVYKREEPEKNASTK